MLKYTSINHNLIKFDIQVVINSNITKKIWVNNIKTKIGKVNIIVELNIINNNEKMIKYYIIKVNDYFFSFFYKA